MLDYVIVKFNFLFDSVFFCNVFNTQHKSQMIRMIVAIIGPKVSGIQYMYKNLSRIKELTVASIL